MSDRVPTADAAIVAGASPDAATPARRGSGSPGDAAPPPSVEPSHGHAPPPIPVGAPLPPVGTPAQLPPLPIPASLETEDEDQSLLRDLGLYLPSWMASMVVHLVLVLLLALVTTLSVVRDTAPSLVVSTDVGDVDHGEPEMLRADALDHSDELQELDPLAAAPLAELPPVALSPGPILPIVPGGELLPLGAEADVDSLMAGVGAGLEMRLDPGLRKAMLAANGGTPESEEAVLRALKWLADHQEYDGSWSFQHHKHPRCNGQCRNPGHTPGKIAATSMALLPFLGTGQTHQEGNYKRTIDLGIKYLVRAIKQQGKIGSLWDPHGTMYGHGLASIVLCEAYGMTHDQALRDPAQSVVNFIVEAQHTGGGWRYHPQTPGDTSVVGWQLMALKSAQMAYLRVPPDTFRKTGYFLDSVQGEGGAIYGYVQPESRRPATTAIGLLCRMYLGWDRDTKPLAHGVQILGVLGPSIDKSVMRNNMYYNYYATQVMHHWGGSEWERWNAVMRDYLVQSQARAGHEEGSWYFDGADHGSGAGGRLYCTALAAMTLEVYYRHMPLYRPQSVGD